ncbi:MAG: BON domain-containing protein [Nitrospinaceae bacterium]|jgi:osmotically-inducible protein OsmY|nr:BON domain-containing protein [Nitrospinaceae bacterium]MBT3433912.1 BON domain-containing protein [Nitrospinaceae bacterium]MBT3820539.1 BON domain-containing protein [Nitrospinaceae bacterium]MBT4093166.1 BON domain-containing protein [Nitrospinaceae bacterium]MBT4431943.1 BON domain-containing protein [Nitrospinaceae bacterium]
MSQGQLVRRAGVLVLAGMLALAPGGCAFVVKEVFSRGLQDRTGEEQIYDAGIFSRFTRKIEKINPDLLFDLNVDVWRGRVMLTGLMDDPVLWERLVRVIKEDGQARRIYNEILIVPNKEKGNLETVLPPSQQLKDYLVEMDVKVRLFSDDDVKSVNYHLRSVRNRIYIIGYSRSAIERRRVLRLIREVNGVNEVKDFISIAPAGKYYAGKKQSAKP